MKKNKTEENVDTTAPIEIEIKINYPSEPGSWILEDGKWVPDLSDPVMKEKFKKEKEVKDVST